MDDRKYCVWLASIPGIGSRRFLSLMQYFKSAKNVFNCGYNEIVNSGVVSAEIANVIIKNRNIEKIDSYIKKVIENEIQIIIYSDEIYPKNLANIYDPPPVLYMKGSIKPEDELAIGIVGSRKASEYGLKVAEKLSYQLTKEGVTVISGMAIGIDSAAHNGVIKAGGRTIAVFGCGLLNVYPKSGYALCRDIIKHGAVISEYPIGMEARPEFFPARNRIISGLSKGIVVVEAGLKSGTLITTDFALEQGRDVFAVPGSINSPNSKGTNNLIKNGAKLIDCVEDILNELNINNIGNNSNNIFNNNITDSSLNELETKILNIIGSTGCSLDNIIQQTGFNTGDIISTVTMLEIRGYITQVNGIYYRGLNA